MRTCSTPIASPSCWPRPLPSKARRRHGDLWGPVAGPGLFASRTGFPWMRFAGGPPPRNGASLAFGRGAPAPPRVCPGMPRSKRSRLTRRFSHDWPGMPRPSREDVVAAAKKRPCAQVRPGCTGQCRTGAWGGGCAGGSAVAVPIPAACPPAPRRALVHVRGRCAAGARVRRSAGARLAPGAPGVPAGRKSVAWGMRRRRFGCRRCASPLRFAREPAGP